MMQVPACKQIFVLHLLVVILFASGCDNNNIYLVKTETLRVQSLDQIVMLRDTLVKPLLYTNIRGLDTLPRAKAKAKFISTILPSILVAKHQMEQHRKKIRKLKEKTYWNKKDSALYHDAKVRFNAKDVDDLILRMGTLPTSLVLAQAAVESGWGKSRFFLKANNLFGVWSFKSNEPRIVAKKMRGNKMIFLKAYVDMSQSIIDYFEILSRSGAYRNLRDARLKTQDPFKLLPHLKNFSERKYFYTKQLRSVILVNDFIQYDHYHIDPDYLVEE